MNEDSTTEYFPEAGTSTKANSVSKKCSSMEDLIDQNMIKVNEYPTVKSKKKVIGRVQIKPD